MTTTATQVSVNGLLLGTGTPYVISEFNPYIRSNRHTTTPRPWAAGAWSGREDAEEVAIPLRIIVDATDDETWLAALNQLRSAMRASSTDVELRWTIGTTEYLMQVRPRLVEPETQNVVNGKSKVGCALVALDPLIYSGAEHAQQLGLPSTSGGLTPPFTPPFTVSATLTSGRATIVNAGTEDTPVRFRIDANGASLVQPRVSVLSGSTVSVLRTSLTLDADQWLEIDTGRRTAYLNGLVSRRNKVYDDWPLLPPGSSEIAFDAASYSSVAELTVTWRDAT